MNSYPQYFEVHQMGSLLKYCSCLFLLSFLYALTVFMLDLITVFSFSLCVVFWIILQIHFSSLFILCFCYVSQSAAKYMSSFPFWLLSFPLQKFLFGSLLNLLVSLSSFLFPENIFKFVILFAYGKCSCSKIWLCHSVSEVCVGSFHPCLCRSFLIFVCVCLNILAACWPFPMKNYSQGLQWGLIVCLYPSPTPEICICSAVVPEQHGLIPQIIQGPQPGSVI